MKTNACSHHAVFCAAAAGGFDKRPRYRAARVWFIVMLAAVAVGAVFAHAPIPQLPEYCDFADHRAWYGIPNFLDVVSNVFFLWTGIAGLVFLCRSTSAKAFTMAVERAPYLVFFLGVLGTAFGSSLFHLNPNNATLVWDRLPMTFAFMGLFSAMIGERISLAAGRWLLWPLVIFGVASVGYWWWGERLGAGDLRPYVLVQYFPMLVVPLMLVLFPPRYSGSSWLVACLLFYALAKGLEWADHWVYGWLAVSGHTLKHVASAAATWAILQMLRVRRDLILPEKPTTT